MMKVDKKLDVIAEFLANQIEDILVGEIPEGFEIDEAEEVYQKQKTEVNFGEKI